MAIKRSIDFIDWLVKKGMATKTPNGVVLKQLTNEQLKSLRDEYKNWSTSEQLEFRTKKYVRQK